MPKLAARLRKSTKQLYSKIDSEGPKNGKSKKSRESLEDLDVDSSRDSMAVDEEEQPQCLHSDWPRAPRPRPRYHSTVSTRSDALGRLKTTGRTVESDKFDSESESAHFSSRPRSSHRSLHTATLHGIRVHHRIRQSLVKPFQDIKFRVHELQVQTRRKCRRLRLRADSLLGRTIEVALRPWQAVQGCLYGLLLVCFGVAEILFSIIFTILYKTLKVVVTTLLIPVIIVITIINALRCQ
ncbi:hypothetical protein E1B28_013631 [Marasmius oreades]|uniref:Uncharacterized protein n=1 Tax=Marasmius oreades TaxID=181124 RepID=A0A9P7RQT5_9AGAR|nr:uncharacterized protein E1B28_013631 [Marasmius oreades]KAG7087683.1 hypothetical protein E1B28_013631 [Marasmius oreades]